ncbi:MAG: hypothetical protein ABI451_03485, partial [Dokdonella sp.]
MVRIEKLALLSLCCLIPMATFAHDADSQDAAKGSHHRSHDHSHHRAGAEPKFFPRAGGPANLPFSEAVQVGHMLYLSG